MTTSLVSLLTLASLLNAAAVEPAAPAPRFDATEIAAIHAELDKRWHRVAGDAVPNQGVRELFNTIFEAMASGWHPERIDHLLDLADRFQDSDQSSPTYGNFRWTFSEAKVLDRNAVQFCMQQAALGWWFYHASLPEAARAHFAKILALAVEGVRRQPVRESYTNIFVMKAWNTIALGEALDLPAVADEGYHLFAAWLADVEKEGVHEYLSPTYTGTDLESLSLLARFAHRESGRAQADAALRLVWTDLAANWFAPAERLGGAHSRDYDYLTGHGQLEDHLRWAGWLGADALPVVGFRGAYARFAQRPPPAGVRDSVAALPRTVIDRWGPQPWDRAVDYLSSGFCLGSAGCSYANMDKPLTMSWAGDPKLPMMSFVMDGRGDPYGTEHIPEATGAHQKSLHLTPFIISVQRQGEALFAASMDMALKNVGHDRSALTMLAAQLVLPQMDEVWVGERQLAPGADAEDAHLVVLRKGGVALGVRTVLAVDQQGAVSTTALINDDADKHACRLCTKLAAGKPDDGRGTVVLFVRAADGLDAAGFAAFRKAFAATEAKAKLAQNRLDAHVAGLHGEMSLSADLAKGERLATDGGEPGLAEALLSVDGKELGRGILAALPGITEAPAAKP